MGNDTNQAHKDIIRYTSCGYHCFGQCILKVRIREGVIVSCEPDDTINPDVSRDDRQLSEGKMNQGMVQIRPCAKGYAQTHMVYDSDRVKHPMKRVGKRGEAKFQRISWDEAIDTITEKLVETRDKYGPLSILHHPYSIRGKSSFPIAPWFGAGVAAWATHSSAGWHEPVNWVLGKNNKPGRVFQDEVQIFNSKLIVLWGLNPLTTLNGAWAHNLLRAKERGIPIICIEPRYTPTVEVLADQWIPLRPTTDAAMMIAIANIWFKEDLYDKDFVDQFVEPEGLQLWRDYVLGIDDGIDKNPEWAEEICGAPKETIDAFARLFATSKPVNLNVSLSIGRQIYGENPARASMYLQALSGNSCIPGGTAAAETGSWLGRPAGSRPEVDWQRKPGSYKPPVLMMIHKWPKAVDLREKLDKGEISKEYYNSMIGSAAGNPAPNIQMVIIDGNNHVNSLPDINTTIRALKKIDFVVVASQYADAPTARYADILLPQIHTAFEGRNCGGFPGIDARESLFHFGLNLANFFIYRQKCIDPVGEVKSHDWVWTQIAKKLGIAEDYNPRMANVADENWDDAIEELHREAYEKWARTEEIAPLNPPSWENFQHNPIFRYEINDPYYPFKEYREGGTNPFDGTDSGKIEFFSKFLAKGPEHLANSVVSPEGGSYGGGNLPPMAKMTMGGRDTFHSQETENFPLLMSSPHSFFRMHSFLDNQGMLRDECYRHAIWMNVGDAKVRGIKDNDSVRIFNDIGEMIIPAYVTSRLIPGTVCVFHGGWYRPGQEKSQLMPDGIDRGGAPNVLIHDEELPQTIIDVFPCKGLVEVEKSEAI